MLRRRHLLAGATAGATACLVPRAARAAEANKKRILVVGSSLTVGAFGSALERGLQARGYETLRFAKSATGLSRPDFFDWFKTGRELYDDFWPHGTIAVFGGNDAQGIRVGGDRDWVRWPDSDWGQTYRRQIAKMCTAVAPAAERVMFVGPLPMRSPSFSKKMDILCSHFSAEMELRRYGQFIDARPVMSKNGKYTDSLKIDGTSMKVRSPDGIHATRAGALHLAAAVADQAHTFMGTPLRRRSPTDGVSQPRFRW